MAVLTSFASTAKCDAPASDATPVIGFIHRDAAQWEPEWRKYTGYNPALQQHGMQGGLIDQRLLYRTPLEPGQFYEQLKKYHAVVIATAADDSIHMTDEDLRRVKVAAADLARYAREGGGVFFNLQAVRYPGDDDETFYNELLKPFGVQMIHQGVYDPTTAFMSPATPAILPIDFFSTTNVTPHAVTQGVRGLCLPVYGDGVSSEHKSPGVEAFALDDAWTVVVAGDKTAGVFRVGPDNGLDIHTATKPASAPPIVAVRSFGKGRVVAFSCRLRHTFANYGNPFWPQITESLGDPSGGAPSDGNRLLINALKWISEPALNNAELGGRSFAAERPIVFEESIDWDAVQFTPPMVGKRGVTGLHSSYTDGTSTVAEYAAAAKQAGLSFIVFTEPLELLTEEKLTKLKADCAAVSDDDFYACPGVEYTDTLGVRWVRFGQKVVYPQQTLHDKGKDFSVWDGAMMYCIGAYAVMGSYTQNGIVDYKALRDADAHPANLWWFFRVFPWAYDDNKLIADNVDEYLYALRDLRYIAIDGFTRIRSADQVATAANTCATSINMMPQVRAILNGRCAISGAAANANQFVTQGPQIYQWSCINNQMEHPWNLTRGAQRVRLRFSVGSEAGVKEVRVHDADRGVIRRFDASGADTLEREFEIVHDGQHDLVLEVVDNAGKRALSAYYLIYCYKSGLYRCGDNLNTLGSASLVWHPDRNQMPSLVAFHENGVCVTVREIDSGRGVATQPSVNPMEHIQTAEGTYPASREEGVVNKIPDVILGSTDLQIYTTHMDWLSQAYDTQARPTPAQGPIARRIEPLKYITRTHTTYAAAGRVNYFVAWNHRRPNEGAQNYKGSIAWNEGEIHFVRDVTLRGAVPVPLLAITSPGGAKFDLSNRFYVRDLEHGLISHTLTPDDTAPYRQAGVITPGGYAATLNTDLGYYAFFAGSDSHFRYNIYTTAQNPTQYGNLIIGLGEDGQTVKAGTVWKYRFALAAVAQPDKDNQRLDDMAQTYNFDGGRNGYDVTATVGEIVDEQFFLTLKASDGETLFDAGPRAMICDLPMRVQGLDNNGCAAVYAKNRGFFRFVPVVGDTAYFQEAIDDGASLWVGNPLRCEDKDVKLTLVVDGQAPGAPPKLEVHNPTHKPIHTRIFSPKHTPMFGGLEAEVDLPAGDSRVFHIVDGRLLDAGADAAAPAGS